VGRNSYGTIAGCKNLGGVFGLFAGGIVGADYDFETMNNAGNSTGSITDSTRNVLPKQYQEYSGLNLYVNGKSLTNISYQGITIENLDEWFDCQKELLETLGKTLSAFYTTERNSKESELKIKTNRVLGAIIGVTDKLIYNELIDLDGNGKTDVLDISIGKYNTDTPPKLVEDKDFISSINIDALYDNDKANSEIFSNSSEDIENDTDPDNTYTYLQKYLFDNSKSEYYYFVAVTNAKYDFWNLNSGYSEGYLRVFKER